MSISDSSLPWIEKYRPSSLNDVVEQNEVTAALRNTLTSGDLPHLLFYGPPGTGKTSTILALSRELFGADLVRSRVLELNASHERGIDVVRDRVKTFAQIAVNTAQKHPITGNTVPPFKIIILDEADCMTRDAQSALRRTMENYSQTTRFCIICNYISRIIAPITSRCAKFRFHLVQSDNMIQRLQMIADAETLRIEHAALVQLISSSQGDMRRAVTLLQTSALVQGTNVEGSTPNTVTVEMIDEIAGTIPMTVVQKLWKTTTVNNSTGLLSAAKAIIRLGYPVDQINARLMTYLIQLRQEQPDAISDVALSQLAIRIAECENRLMNGGGELLQLMDILSCCVEINATR